MKTPIPFGKYYLLDRINVGGMAEVFLAKAFGLEGFERIVAIKRILPAIAEDKEFTSMFIDEAKIAVQLNHANICQVFDLGKVEESYFIALEYVSGRDLRAAFDRCKQRLVDGMATMPIAQSCFVMMKVCEGLDYAHNKKDSLGHELHLVHRDVSPQNIIVSFDGEVKLIDFGIAKAAGKATQTQAGILKGKFGYMSPEQVRGLELDRRSDVFSAGIVLYEMLTGERLFVGESDFSTLEKVRNVEILPPTMYNRKIPEELERIVLKGLAREVDERYQSAAELHEDLQAFMYTSGEFYSRKDLSGWMKRVFREEMEQERVTLEAAKAMRPDAPKDDRAGFRTNTSMMAAIRAGGGKDSSWTPERQASAESAAAVRPRQRVTTPAPLPPPPPRVKPGVLSGPGMAVVPPMSDATPPSGALAGGQTDDEDEYEEEEEHPGGMTMVDGYQQQVAADFHWGEEEVETQLYGDPPPGVVEEQEKEAAARAAAQPPAEQVVQAPSAMTQAAVLGGAAGEAHRVSPEEGPASARSPVREGPSSAAVPAAVVAALSGDPVPVAAQGAGRAQSAPQPVVDAGSQPSGLRSAPGLSAPGEAAIRSGMQQPGGQRAPASTVLLAVVLGIVLIVGCAVGYLVLAARPGDLVLYVDPESGLTVSIDGQPVVVNQMPYQARLKPGAHEVVVEHPGYARWQKTLQIAVGQPTSEKVRLQQLVVRTGGFILKSDPAGAAALLDGQSLGQVTPMKVASVMPGAHQLELRLGKRVWQQQVTLAEGQMLEIQATFQPEKQPEKPVAAVAPPDMAKAAVAEVVPQPAQPAVDKPAVDKPAVDKPAGDRAEERRHHEERPAKADREERAERPKGDQGFLRINTKPWTKISVDGSDTGLTTPQTALKLSAGTHQITLTNPQFSINKTISVTIRSGETETRVEKFPTAE